MTIRGDKLKKSLQQLEEMSKSQLYHTPSDSSVSDWAGSDHTDESPWDDGIDDNGTDYNGVRKGLAGKVRASKALTPAEVAIAEGKADAARKHVTQKISKGERLTQAESWLTKGGYEQMTKGNDKPSESTPTPGEQHGANAAPPTNAGDNTDDEIEEEAKKSFSDGLNDHEDIRKGLELSPFLAKFAEVVSTAIESKDTSTYKALSSLVDRINNIEDTLSKSMQKSEKFQSATAEALVGIGSYVSGQAQAEDAQASQPVGPPKSAQSAQQPPVQKSYQGPGGMDMSLNKALVSDVLVEMNKSGEVDPMAVIEFESTGNLRPEVHQLVVNKINNR